MEPEFLAELDRIAAERHVSFAALVARIDRERDLTVPLTTALRLAVLRDLRNNAASDVPPRSRRSATR